MRSLFLKIFLWFWLAMALLALALFAVTMTIQAEPIISPQRWEITDALDIHSREAVAHFERGGQRALVDYLRSMEGKAHIRTYLFNKNGREVSGRTVPPGAADLAARVAQSREAQFQITRTHILGAHYARGPQGNRYVLLAAMPRTLLAAMRVQPETRFLRLLAILLIGGIFCYGLARYLTAPVVQLRTATRRFAGGDLTARVGPAMGKRRDELADLGRDFDLMAERIESLMLAQRRLLGDISHELRSPLTRLNLALGLARRQSGPEAGAALDRIEREAGQLNTLISQLLALARLESGDAGPQDAIVDLVQLVREVAADADFEARSRNRAVHIVASEACCTPGSAELLRSAVENVVRNAVRYTAEHSVVEVALRCERGAASSGAEAVISVRDRGPGVPETALADLFLPFYRVADARDRQSGGMGLGLAITERAVRSHGGGVVAANAPGGGLRVELRLPVIPSPVLNTDLMPT